MAEGAHRRAALGPVGAEDDAAEHLGGLDRRTAGTGGHERRERPARATRRSGRSPGRACRPTPSCGARRRRRRSGPARRWRPGAPGGSGGGSSSGGGIGWNVTVGTDTKAASIGSGTSGVNGSASPTAPAASAWSCRSTTTATSWSVGAPHEHELVALAVAHHRARGPRRAQHRPARDRSPSRWCRRPRAPTAPSTNASSTDSSNSSAPSSSSSSTSPMRRPSARL